MGAAASSSRRTARSTSSKHRTGADQYSTLVRSVVRADLPAMSRCLSKRPEYFSLSKHWLAASALTSAEPLQLLFSLAEYWRGHAAAPGEGALTSAVPSNLDLANLRDGHKTTLLMEAARCGSLANCRLLLNEGADPWLTDASGQTALHLAASAGHAAAAELLLKAAAAGGCGRTLAGRAYPDVFCRAGVTAMHLAVTRRRADVVVVLLRHGASPSARTRAVTQKQLAQLRAEHGVPVAAGLQATPMHIAAVLCDAPVVRVLLTHYLEEQLVRAKATMHDPRLQRNGAGERPQDLAAAAMAAQAVSGSACRPASAAGSVGGSSGHMAGPVVDPRLLSALDPEVGLQQLMPEVVRAATAIRGHRRITGAVPTLQVLAAAALASRLAASAATASSSRAAGATSKGRDAAAAAAEIVAVGPAPRGARSADAAGKLAGGEPAASRVVSGKALQAVAPRVSAAVAGGTAAGTQAVPPSARPAAACAAAGHKEAVAKIAVSKGVSTPPAVRSSAGTPRSAAAVDVRGVAGACGGPRAALKSGTVACAAAVPQLAGAALAGCCGARGPALERSDSASSTDSCGSSSSSSTTGGGSQRSSSRTSSRSSNCGSNNNSSTRGRSSAGRETAVDEMCGICMAAACSVRSGGCSHGMCGGCAVQLCGQVCSKLTPLSCPFCRRMVAGFVPL